jgi:TfoX/Sxy family transcriptional regulator of competence genes
MPYNTDLAQRVREVLSGTPGLSERKQFGGIGFLVGGNMACGVIGDDMMVRVGPESYAQALQQPHTRPFDFGGRPPSKGWVFVSPAGVENEQGLRAWVQRGVDYAASLPAK